MKFNTTENSLRIDPTHLDCEWHKQMFEVDSVQRNLQLATNSRIQVEGFWIVTLCSFAVG